MGTTGVEVSVVGIGGWQMGGADPPDGLGHGWGDVDDDHSVRIIHREEELGVNLMNTSDTYGLGGHSERVIGRALRGRRDRWVVCTKVGHIKTPGRAGITRDFSAPQVRKGIDASLERLQTGYIDFYQLHGDPEDHQMADTLAELQRLQEAGKIRFYGISTGNLQKLQLMEEAGGFHVAQIGFSLLNRAEEAAIDWCHQRDIAVLIRSPLAWGAAFSRYSRATLPEFEAGDLRRRRDREKMLAQHEEGRRFSFLWEGAGRSPAQAALRFVLDKPGVTAAIPGTRRIEHLEDNVRAAAAPPLTAEEIAAVHRVEG